MYIKLGNTNINYVNKETESNYMIISDLIDSDLSYENPVLVNTEEELDIWFSQDFKDKNYLKTLLGNNVSLYLYKPLSSKNSTKEGDIDLNDFEEITFNYLSLSESTLQYLEDFKNSEYKILVNYIKDLEIYKLSTTFSDVSENVEISYKSGVYIFNTGEEKHTGDKLIIDDKNCKTVEYLSNIVEDNLFIENKNTSSIIFKYQDKNILIKPQYGIRLHEFNNKIQGTLYSVGNQTIKSIEESKFCEYDSTTESFIDSPEDSSLPLLSISIDSRDLEALSKFKKLENIKIKYNNIFYIWNYNEFISELELPQNIEGRSVSLDNRETILITTKDSSVSYCYPEYRQFEKEKLGIYSDKYSGKYLINTKSVDLERIDSGLDSFIVHISAEDTDAVYSGYITIDIGGKLYYYYSKDFDKNILKYKESILLGYSEEELAPKKFISEFIRLFSPICSENNIEIIQELETKVTLLSKKNPFMVNYFFNFPKISIDSSIEENNLFITKSILESTSEIREFSGDLREKSKLIDENRKSLDVSVGFYSKVIGTWNEKETEGYTTIAIDNIDDTYYRVTITKYDYEEIFEGPIVPIPGEDTLENLVSKNSKLVYCEFFNISSGIPEGTFVLKNINNIEEIKNPSSWFTSLDIMLGNSSRDIYPDFFLVSDMNNYISSLDPNYNYYKEYLTFLKYSKLQNMQFLIQNSESKYKYLKVDKLPDNLEEGIIYHRESENLGNRYYKYEDGKVSLAETWEVFLAVRGNDYVYNYTGDTENRLVYFYNPIYLDEVELPGYCLYLNSLINNNFPGKSSLINYDSPGGMTTYEDTDLEKELKKYKSNYLTFNNLKYFYNQIFNGDKYATTGYLRFILGKISRELGKSSGKIISTRNYNDVYRSIYKILSIISNTFSDIVISISIVSFEPSEETNSLDIGIETKVGEFVDSDITINLTINYNNNYEQQ